MNQVLDDLLAQAAVAQAPPQLNECRRAAAQIVQNLGLPTIKNEHWKYTSIAALGKQSYRLSDAASASAVAAASLAALTPATSDDLCAVVVNGYLRDDLSNLGQLPDGIRVRSFSSVLAQADDQANALLEALANEPWDDNKGAGSASFTALNTATLSDGVLIEADENSCCDRPIAIRIIGSGEQAMMRAPRIIIQLGHAAKVRVIEEYLSTDGDLGLTNAVSTIELAEGAELYHHRLQAEAETSAHIGRLIARVGRNASFNSDSIAFGGALTRVDLDIALADRGARCRLLGLFTGHNQQHFDHHTTVDHQVGDTHSEELYRGILDHRSRGVFNGKVIVRPDAQKISAKQASNNLLLSGQAEIDTKPELEIYADDVTCAHGATVGQLDPLALFYLRSRGVSEADARALLIYAFASELVKAIPLASLRTAIETRFIGHTKMSEVIGGINS